MRLWLTVASFFLTTLANADGAHLYSGRVVGTSTSDSNLVVRCDYKLTIDKEGSKITFYTTINNCDDDDWDSDQGDEGVFKLEGKKILYGSKVIGTYERDRITNSEWRLVLERGIGGWTTTEHHSLYDQDGNQYFFVFQGNVRRKRIH